MNLKYIDFRKLIKRTERRSAAGSDYETGHQSEGGVTGLTFLDQGHSTPKKDNTLLFWSCYNEKQRECHFLCLFIDDTETNETTQIHVYTTDKVKPFFLWL